MPTNPSAIHSGSSGSDSARDREDLTQLREPPGLLAAGGLLVRARAARAGCGHDERIRAGRSRSAAAGRPDRTLVGDDRAPGRLRRAGWRPPVGRVGAGVGQVRQCRRQGARLGVPSPAPRAARRGRRSGPAGPDMTPAKPMASASSRSSTNSSGRTHRSTGWCSGDGRRYWVMVSRSQPASCRSRRACETSCAGLAQPEDEVGLGDHAGGPALGRARPASARSRNAGPDPLEDPRHGLEVVREHLRGGVEDLAEQARARPEKSGTRISTPVPGLRRVDRADGLGVQPGALVLQVVAGDPGDGGVAQPHGLHAAATRRGSSRSSGAGLPAVDLAEVAAPGALVAADEEGRLAVLPALEDVRAARLLADRVQALALHQGGQLAVLPGPSAPWCGSTPACARSGSAALRASTRSRRRPSGATDTMDLPHPRRTIPASHRNRPPTSLRRPGDQASEGRP